MRPKLLLFPFLLAGCAPAGLPESAPVPRSESNLVVFGGHDSLPAEPALFASLIIPEAGQNEVPVDIRARSMREAALAWGAAHGQARRSWEIARSYLERKGKLDAVWNFRRVSLPAPMAAGWVLPPVIQRAGAAWSGGERKAEAATQYYQILRPGRLSGRLPGWRDYLPLPTEEPDRPAEALLPKEGETEQWREWAAEGWLAGIELAETEYREALARLERDYSGMLEYRRLLAMGMLRDMVVEAEHWPAAISEDGNALRVGGRRVTILSDAGFVADTGAWKPLVVAVEPAS